VGARTDDRTLDPRGEPPRSAQRAAGSGPDRRQGRPLPVLTGRALGWCAVHVDADGKTGRDAAWIYREPKDAASNIKDHVAFWHGVVVSAAG
jgi:Domain of unknown function (DUF427)